MDEAAGDQLDNSNLQDQDKSQLQSASSSSSPPQQQQQQLQLGEQQSLQQQLPISASSSSSLTTNNDSSHNLEHNSLDQPTNTNNTKPNDSSANKHSEEPASDKANKSNNEHLPKRNPTEDLFSTTKWGVTPIRQDTPWELPPSPTQPTSAAASNLAGQSAAPIGTSNVSSLGLAVAPGSTSIVGGSASLMADASSALPPGISQSGDSFRTGSSVNDFHGQSMVNNFGVDSLNANGLANSLGHMNLGGAGALHSSSRFDPPWRTPAVKQHQPPMAASSPFANHNLMNPGAPGSLQKSMLNSGNGGSSFGGLQQHLQGNSEFARAPGPASSIMDNNLAPKPFGMTNRSSTWSAFGSSSQNHPEPEWPKSSSSGISTSNSNQQPSNAFDMVPEFEPGKSWHGSMLMKSMDDDASINSAPNAMSAFANAYSTSSKSPTGSQYEPSGIGTWSPVVKGGRPGSKWDGDGPDNGRSDNGRFDDGTAIWGSPAQSKVAGVDWVDKSGGGDPNSNNDKSRSMAGNNQSYRPQSSSSTSLLMSSNTSPSSQHNRVQPSLKQPTLSHNFDQVQQQSNALSSQANQPNRSLGLSSNVPSTQQLKHMVQQIQLAVQAGHLNPQILNQPLAPVTLQLLYQLLQQIKVLHQLQMQASPQFNKPGNHPAAVNVHITKTKQNILNLQNQIAAQQAVYLKQNQAHNISSRQPTMPSLATGGMGVGIGPALPPGISQSGDSFRTGSSVNDFHGQSMVNNFGVDSLNANGLANSLGHMNLGGAGALHSSSRFDPPWRTPAVKQHQPPMTASSPFANHNLMNPGAPGSLQKSMLNSGNGGSSFGGLQQHLQGNSEFARAPGPASSIMDNNLAPKPFGMTNRSSTWSAFGSSSQNDPEPEWPKSSSSGISASNSTQQSNAFDLVPEFEPGKPWRGSMLMKSVEDDPTMTPGSMTRSLAPQRKTIWSDEIL